MNVHVKDIAFTDHPKIDAARGMVTVLRDLATSVSSARRLSDEVLDRLYDAGLMQLRRPSRFGGTPVPLDVAYSVGRELARGDGSVAWVYAVYTSHDHLIGFFPEEVQEQYWDTPRALSASSYIPMGKATPVDGGFRLTGQWPFCSGIDHATCAVIGSVAGMIEGDKPRPDVRLFLVPSADYKIIDDWHVMGLQGTGSKSIYLDDVFVPHSNVLRQDELQAGYAPETSVAADPTFRYPVWTLLTFSQSALATGMVRNAYEDLVEQFVARAGKNEPLFESRKASIEIQLGTLSAIIDCSDMIFKRALNETFARVNAGLELPEGLPVANRRDLSYSVKLAHEASNSIIAIGGARNIRDGGVIQRAHRDLCAVAVHPSASWDANAQLYGSFVLGTKPKEAHWI